MVYKTLVDNPGTMQRLVQLDNLDGNEIEIRLRESLINSSSHFAGYSYLLFCIKASA